MPKNIWVNGGGSLILLLVLVSLQLNAIAGASLGIGGGDGLGGSLTAYNEDENDRVITHSLDPQNSDDSGGVGEYSNPDQVIKTVVNINDSNAAALLLNFNVSKDEILRRISAQQPMQAVTAVETHADDETNATTMEGVSEQRDMFMDAFKKRIESAVERNGSKGFPDPNAVIHEMALYPTCSKNNETSWLEENTAKLYFSSNLFDKLMPNTFLHRAVLRLHQRNPDTVQRSDKSQQPQQSEEQPVSCSEPEDMVRVTVSIMVKRHIRGGNNRIGSNANSGNNRREFKYKKLVCHSFMTNRVKIGWTEIDMRQVIKHWEKIYRTNASHNKGTIPDPMVAIDVEDEFQNPLKAGLFFEPTDCQASTAIPWSLYGERRDLFEAHLLPLYPRLDITWSRLHRSHQHYYRRLHRHRNRLENFRLLKDSPLMPADYQDYQYRAAADGAVAVAATPNFVSEETTHQRNHRKRHVQHKQYHDSANNSQSNEDEPQYQRQRRSLNRVNRNSSRRRLAARSVSS